MTYDNISPLETFEQALGDPRLRRVPRRAGRGARRRPLSRRRDRRTTSSRRRPATAATATEAATIRIEPSGMVNVYIAGGSTGNSLETTVVQLAADALGVRIEDVHTIQGDTARHGLRRRDGRQPQRVDDRRRDPRDGDDPARAHLRDRRAPARSRGRRHRARREPRARARHAVDRHLARRDRGARLLRAARAAAGRARRSRGERALHRGRAVDLGERHARVHVRGRRRDRAASRSCATS